MSFNPKKAKFTVNNKPKATRAQVVKLPIPVAATAISLAATKIPNLKQEVPFSEVGSNVGVTKNKDTSSFHGEIFKKGINAIRPEILMINEYSPIVTGRKVEENENSINVKYGNNTFVEVTNTARLLELHQILKENAVYTSDALIKRYTTIPAQIRLVILKFKTALKVNINDIYDSNIDVMRKSLIDKTFEAENNITIRQAINRLSQDVLLLITDFVMNDYVAQKIMEYVAKVFDFKEAIESGIELNRASKIPATIETYNSDADSIPENNSLEKLLGRRHHQSRLPTGKRETNFENFLDTTNYLRSLIRMDDAAADIGNEAHELNDSTAKGSKKGRLKASIDAFRKINFPGCFGSTQRKASIPSAERMVGSNITNAIEKLNLETTSESIAELIAALCYNQVTGATSFQREFKNVENKLSNGETFIKTLELFQKEIVNLNIVDNKVSHKVTFEEVMSSIKSSPLVSDKKAGYITKQLFRTKVSAYDNKSYNPFETNNTISGKIYDNNQHFPAEETYFTSALKSDDLDFKEFENFILEYKSSWKSFSSNIIKSLGLDFDIRGKKSFDDLNIIDQMNPISYLNFYLNVLADDLEANYINSATRRKKSLPGLAMLLNNFESMDWTVSSFKATLLGTLSNADIGAFFLLSDQSSGENWIEDKAEAIINTLYHETEAQTEKSFQKLLDDIGVDNYPVANRDFPDDGKYDITLTATGYFDGTLGTFKTDQKRYTGVSSSDRIAGEPDENFKRYNYGHSGAADIILTEALNLKVTTDWLGPTLAIATALLIIGTGGLAGLTLISGYVMITGVGIALTAVGAISATAAGIASAISSEAIDKSRPLGPQITSSGLYTFNTILDTGLTLNVESKENLQTPNVSDETISSANTYFFKNRSGNNQFRYLENRSPGVFGIKRLTAVNRAFLFHYLAVQLLAKTQRVLVYTTGDNPYPDGPDLKISFKISRMRGLIKALRNESIGSNAIQSEEQAYTTAKQIIMQIKRKIAKRQRHILRTLNVINEKIDSLESVHKNLKNFLASSTNDSFKIARKKLEENNFFDKTAPLLTPAYKDYLALSYHRNFIMSSQTANTFTEYDKGNLTDLKIMYRVLTTKNFGFLEKEKFGRKNIYHVGIPIGLMDYLRREAFKATGDEDYLDSSLMTLTVHKNNQLNAEIEYMPKQYIFDTTKHILPFSYFKGSARYRTANHIVKATDDKDLEKVIKDMEIYTFNDDTNFGFKSNGIGLEGIIGNRTSELKNNYNDIIKKDVLLNHIFDYYLKMYTQLSTGIEISESTFLLSSENVFTGQPDNQTAQNIKNQIYNNYLRDYPDVANDATQRELFSRSINLIGSSPLFSSNNRLKEMMSMNCFERVYSILINDKDFVIDTSENNEIYQSAPKASFGPKIMRTPFVTGGKALNDRVVKSHIQETGEKSTSMSGFSVEIGIIKKW